MDGCPQPEDQSARALPRGLGMSLGSKVSKGLFGSPPEDMLKSQPQRLCLEIGLLPM